MNKGKVIAGLLIAAGTSIAVYYGFFYTLEDGLTHWKRLIGSKPPVPPTKDGGGEVRPPKPIDQIVPPLVTPSGFKRLEQIYAEKDLGLFTKPVAETKYLKAKAYRFDSLGTFHSNSEDYPGWSKIWVGRTFKNALGTPVPSNWTGFVKTSYLTNKKP